MCVCDFFTKQLIRTNVCDFFHKTTNLYQCVCVIFFTKQLIRTNVCVCDFLYKTTNPYQSVQISEIRTSILSQSIKSQKILIQILNDKSAKLHFLNIENPKNYNCDYAKFIILFSEVFQG
ncbi:MAG: hypothetical protein RL329_4254 [Bacteroidota bacterium]